jgi:Aspartyl protease
MKGTISGLTVRWLVSLSLVGIALPILQAEAHCPGNVASVPLHLVNRYLFVVAVSINRSGPYNFLLDTGTQTTAVDRSLAGELHLNLEGAPVVEGIGFQATASSARLDLLAAGPHAVANQKVVVYDFPSPADGGLPVRGVLGEDFLEHFDMLIDNSHSLVCLDDSGAMRADMKGPHTPLVSPGQAADGIASSRSLIVEARLSDQTGPVRLWLDCGANVSFLFKLSEYLSRKVDRNARLQGMGGNAAQTSYLALPAQDLKVASLKLQNVAFLTPAITQKNLQVAEFDGLLSTWLFRRVFIDHADRFAVLEAW